MFQMLEESFAWDQVYQVSAPWTKEDPGGAELWLAEVGSCAHSQDLQGPYVYEENANKQSHCSNITFWYSLDPKGRLVCSSRAAIAPGKYLDGSKRKFYAMEFLQGGNCVCLPSIWYRKWGLRASWVWVELLHGRQRVEFASQESWEEEKTAERFRDLPGRQDRLRKCLQWSAHHHAHQAWSTMTGNSWDKCLKGVVWETVKGLGDGLSLRQAELRQQADMDAGDRRTLIPVWL